MRGRLIVKRVVDTCVLCKHQLEKGILPPPSPRLPEFRVRGNREFRTTDVDSSGPVMGKPIYKSGLMQVLNPAYICLIPWATTRERHLELGANLESEAFINAGI